MKITVRGQLLRQYLATYNFHAFNTLSESGRMLDWTPRTPWRWASGSASSAGPHCHWRQPRRGAAGRGPYTDPKYINPILLSNIGV